MGLLSVLEGTLFSAEHTGQNIFVGTAPKIIIRIGLFIISPKMEVCINQKYLSLRSVSDKYCH